MKGPGLRARLAGAWRALRSGGAPAGSNLGMGWSGGPAYTDAFGAKRAPTPWQLVESYKSIIYFCVELNAKRLQRVPLRLYAASGRGNRPRSACGPRPVPRRLAWHARSLGYVPRSLAGAAHLEEVTRHPFLDLLDRPDPFGYFSRRKLLGLVCRYLDVCGSAYCRPFGLAGGFPEELWPLQSQYVWPVSKGTTALIDYYNYFTDKYKFDDLLRFTWDSLRNPYGAGYGPAQAAWEYAQLEDKFVSVQEAFLSSGPIPALIVSPADAKLPIGPETAERLEQDLNRKFARGAAARVWVQQTPLKADRLSAPPTDLAAKEVSEYDLQRTANCFGVPVAMLTPETNLANSQAAHRQHAENAVEPRCHLIAEALTALVQRYDDRLFAAFDPVLREDEESKARVHQVYLGTAVFTPNDVRAEIGYEPVPWGDEPWISNTLTQPSAAEEQRQASLESMKAAAAGQALPGPGKGQGDKPAKEGRSVDPADVTVTESKAWAQIDRVLVALQAELAERRGAAGP